MKFKNKKLLKLLSLGFLVTIPSATLIGTLVANETNNQTKTLLNQTTETKSSTRSLKQAPTGFAKKQRVMIDGYINAYTDEYSYEEMKDFIFKHLDLFFVNYPDGLTIDDIDLAQYDMWSQKVGGQILIEVTLTKYYDQNGNLVNYGNDLEPREFAIDGFRKVDTNSTYLLDGDVYLANPLNFRADQINENRNNIELFSNEVIKALNAPNSPLRGIQKDATGKPKKLTRDDIKIVTDRIQWNNELGILNCRIDLFRNIGLIDGQPSELLGMRLNFWGFKTNPITNYSKKKYFTVPNQSNTFTDAFSKEQAIQYIFDHKDEFIVNYPPDLTKDQIIIEKDKGDIKNFDNTSYKDAGVIKVRITLSNFYNQIGTHITTFNNDDKGTFYLGGFKTNSNTTTLAPSTLSGVQDIYATNIRNWNENQLIPIKEAIIKNIANPAKQLTVDDIGIKISENKPGSGFYGLNNTDGTMTVTVTLKNSSGKVDGVIKNELVLNEVTLDGFKVQAATRFKAPRWFYIPNVANRNTKTFTRDEMKTYILDNVDKFLDNYSPTISKDDILFAMYSNRGGSTVGVIDIEIWLKNFYDDDGTLKNIDSSRLVGIYQAVGFQLEDDIGIDATTILESETLHNVSSIMLKDVNESILKPYVVKLIQKPEKKLFEEDIDINIVSRNYENGSVEISVTMNNGTYQENGFPVPSKTLPNISLSGFRIRESTSFKNNPIVFVNGYSDRLSSSIKPEEVAEILVNNLDQVVEHYPDGITKTHFGFIDFDNRGFVDDGQIRLKLMLSRFYGKKQGELIDSSGPEGGSLLGPSDEIIIAGFKSNKPSTSINTNLTFNQQANFLPSEWEANQVAIKQAIIDQGIVNNAIGQITLDDITLTKPMEINDVAGTIKLSVTIPANKAQISGIPKEITTVVLIGNLKTIEPTEYVEYPLLTTDKPELFADEYTEDDIKRLVFNNKDDVFKSLPSDFNIDNIIVTNHKSYLGGGTVTATIKTNKWYDEYGTIINTTKEPGAFLQIQGFNTKGLTTTIDSSLTFDPKATFKPSQWEENQDLIKQEIIEQGIVKNLAKKTGPLTPSDITLSEPSEINDVDGQIKLKVTISATKAWVGGQKQEVSQVVTFTNLHSQGPTKYLDINSIKVPDVSNQLTTSFSKADAINFILEKKEEIFKNYPSGIGASDIYVPEEDGFDNITGKPRGEITIKFQLQRYYDSLGNLVTVGTEMPFKTITLTGFLNIESLTTTIEPSVTFDSKLSFKASEWDENQNAIKNKIISQGIVKNLSPDVTRLSINDIKLDSPTEINDVNGSIQLNVTILPTAAVVNGVNQEVSQRVTFNGFATQEPTSYVANKEVRTSYSSLYTDQFTLDMAYTFIIQNKKSFFINAPEITKKDIVISDFKNDDRRSAKVTFSLQLKKYYDDKGILIENGTGLVATTFTLTNFLKDTTIPPAFTPQEVFLDGIENNFKDFLPNWSKFDLDWNDSTKTEIIQQLTTALGNPENIKKLIVAKPNQTISLSTQPNPIDITFEGGGQTLVNIKFDITTQTKTTETINYDFEVYLESWSGIIINGETMSITKNDKLIYFSDIVDNTKDINEAKALAIEMIVSAINEQLSNKNNLPVKLWNKQITEADLNEITFDENEYINNKVLVVTNLKCESLNVYGSNVNALTYINLVSEVHTNELSKTSGPSIALIVLIVGLGLLFVLVLLIIFWFLKKFTLNQKRYLS